MTVYLLAAALLAAAPQAAPYCAYVLNTDAPVWDVTAQDITGDGKAEISALCCDGESNPPVKFLAVFIADASGGYPGTASLRLDLDPSMSAAFFAETDGKPPLELVAVDAEGATIIQYADGKLTRGASPRFPSLWPSASKEPIFLKETAQDLDNDGIHEWLVPAPMGYEVRTPSESLCRVPCDVVSRMQTFDSPYITHRLPSCHTFALAGEPRQCLAFLSDEYADFAHGPNWSEHTRFKIPLNLEEKWEASSRMQDINGDGLPDLVVTQLKGTVNLQAVTQVYLASAPFTYPDKPTATFEANGAISSPVLSDVDGDGKQDLVFITIPFGVRNLINFFVRGKLSARVEVYLFHDGAYPAKPSYSESILLDAPEGRERVAYALGDFNGDGRMDVAYGENVDRLAIRTGSVPPRAGAQQFVGSRPWVSVSLPTFGIAQAYDLNGNKHQDLLMFHPSGEHKKRIDVVVF